MWQKSCALFGQCKFILPIILNTVISYILHNVLSIVHVLGPWEAGNRMLTGFSQLENWRIVAPWGTGWTRNTCLGLGKEPNNTNCISQHGYSTFICQKKIPGYPIKLSGEQVFFCINLFILSFHPYSYMCPHFTLCCFYIVMWLFIGICLERRAVPLRGRHYAIVKQSKLFMLWNF